MNTRVHSHVPAPDTESQLGTAGSVGHTVGHTEGVTNGRAIRLPACRD